MARIAKINRYRPIKSAHGYFYFAWPELYLKIVRWVLDRGDILPRFFWRGSGNYLVERHHAKVIPAQTARRIVQIEEPVSFTAPERVMPYKEARDVFLAVDGRIALLECPCRSISSNDCKSGGCLIVENDLASFVVKQRPEQARFVSRSEAIAVIDEAHELGRIHTAWFKDVAGGKLYSLCSCCSCCCMGFKALRHGFPLMAPSGFKVEVDPSLCEGCRACVDSCMFGAIDFEQKPQVVRERCFGCGLCISRCPRNAISLNRDKTGILSLDI